jgi:signal transduction histidine kinase
MIMNSYSDKKKDIEIVYEPKDIFIMADKGRISQVISNLLSNALKFTSRGSVSVTSVRSYNGEEASAIIRMFENLPLITSLVAGYLFGS